MPGQYCGPCLRLSEGPIAASSRCARGEMHAPDTSDGSLDWLRRYVHLMSRSPRGGHKVPVGRTSHTHHGPRRPWWRHRYSGAWLESAGTGLGSRIIVGREPPRCRRETWGLRGRHDSAPPARRYTLVIVHIGTMAINQNSMQVRATTL